MAFPKSEKGGLGMVQPFLVLQVFLPAGRPLNIEVAITDSKKVRIINGRQGEDLCSHPAPRSST